MFQVRLKELRENRMLSQNDLAKALNVKQSTVAMWENGTNKPRYSKIEELANFFNVSIDYVLCRDDVIPVEHIKPSTGILIPVLGHVVAGIPIEAIEDIIDYEEISKAMASQGEHFALKVKGDSMEPKISEGDVVIVRKQSDVNSGDIAVVLVNGDEATVKRIKKRPEGLLLSPFNPSYEPMLYTNEDIEKLPVTILGRVVELRAKF